MFQVALFSGHTVVYDHMICVTQVKTAVLHFGSAFTFSMEDGASAGSQVHFLQSWHFRRKCQNRFGEKKVLFLCGWDCSQSRTGNFFRPTQYSNRNYPLLRTVRKKIFFGLRRIDFLDRCCFYWTNNLWKGLDHHYLDAKKESKLI